MVFLSLFVYIKLFWITGAVNKAEKRCVLLTSFLNQLITTVFVEQPLAWYVSAKDRSALVLKDQNQSKLKEKNL